MAANTLREPAILAAQHTAVRRAVVKPDQLADWIPSACAQVAAFLHHHSIPPIGYPFARCRQLQHGLIEMDAGFPIAAPLSCSVIGPSGVEPSTLPAGPAVLLRHNGPEDKVATTARQAIDDWLPLQDAERSGAPWAIYPDLPRRNRARRRIEVVQPISFSKVAV